MTTTDQPTELLPALLYESLPKPPPYPFNTPPAPTKPRQSHPRYEVKLRLPFYPGAAWQTPTPGYPPTPPRTRDKPEPRTAEKHERRHHTPRPQPDPTDPHPPPEPVAPTRHRAPRLTDLSGNQIRDALIRAATPPEPVSLLNPTGEFARQVDAVARARRAEEAIPKEHLPKRRIALRLRRFLPVISLVATCHHCGQAWPCRRLRRHLTARHGKDIDLPVLRLSTRRRRARADRRSPTAITHRPKPRRIDQQEQRLGLK